jgi:hypothetical protein
LYHKKYLQTGANTMKQYQIKALERIRPSDHKAALDVLGTPFATLLDYQIEQLTGAVNSQVNIERHTPETIDTWKNMLALLQEVSNLDTKQREGVLKGGAK